MRCKTQMAAIGATMLFGLSAPPAQAGYVVDLTEQAGNVVATGSGEIDLSGLSFFEIQHDPAAIFPSFAVIVTGPASVTNDEYYTGFTGPTSFGSGGVIDTASSGSGDKVGIGGGVDVLVVPRSYVSGSPLSDTSTYDGQTFTSLGVTPGTYEWTWGNGANQNFTLVIEVPEPATWATMLTGFAGLGFVGYRQRHKNSALAREL
jgi:hypothetical protein